MTRVLVAAGLLLAISSAAASAGSTREVKITLRGSHESMERQNRIARLEAFSFLRTNRDVTRYADAGTLVPFPGNEDYLVVADWPYARPVVRQFVELLAHEYRDACGEQLVVTSLTRPSTRQPENASPLSVHPAGMAVDLRVSERRKCVKWLESQLLDLEAAGLLDGTREYHPPHFHVAVFPEAFSGFVAERAADSLRAVQAERDSIQAAWQRELPAAELASASADATPSPAAGWTPVNLLGDLLAIVGRLLLRV